MAQVKVDSPLSCSDKALGISTITSALKVRILFADAGCFDPKLKKCLEDDKRKDLTMWDILTAADFGEASIIIGSDLPADRFPAAINSSISMKSLQCMLPSDLPQVSTQQRTLQVWYDETKWSVGVNLLSSDTFSPYPITSKTHTRYGAVMTLVYQHSPFDVELIF